MSKHFSHLCLLMPLILISFEGFCESSCIPQDKDCLFYVNCLEKSQSCGSKGYALSYGLPYCQKFKEEVRFSEKAQVWRRQV